MNITANASAATYQLGAAQRAPSSLGRSTPVGSGNRAPGGTESTEGKRAAEPSQATRATSPKSPRSQAEAVEQEQRQRVVRDLKARDREVRAHEAAHQSVGGAHAGAVSYTFQRSPNGQSYAVGGEVPIDVSPVAGDPQATIEKMRTVRAAALAPAEPSAQDQQVAAQASQRLLQAQAELAEQSSEKASAASPAESGPSPTESGSEPSGTDSAESDQNTSESALSARARQDATNAYVGISAFAGTELPEPPGFSAVA